MHKKVFIAGTNDIATACALRLFRSAFKIAMISVDTPLDLFYKRNYSPVLATGSKIIDHVRAQSYADFLYNQPVTESATLDTFVEFSFNNRQIAVLSREDIKKVTLVFDYCILCEESLYEALNFNKSTMTLISCVTKKLPRSGYDIILSGANRGRVNYPFLEYETASSVSEKEILRATQDGVFVAHKAAGDRVVEGETIAMLDGSVVKADRTGIISGIIRSGVIVTRGSKVALID